ncbi:MAG: GNAT family N-acetyltransferase [Sulfuriferula sp.]
MLIANSTATLSDADAAHSFLAARFEHAKSVIFMALDGLTPLGFTQLYPSFSSISLARIFILNDLYVDVHARRKGVASKLMSAAVEFARSQGAVRVSLSTATTNVTAQALYQLVSISRLETR